MFVPVILGNDKTTVSVATGQNDFYPVYLSIGNIHNSTRRSRRNGVAVVAFLAIPKGPFCFSSSGLRFSLTLAPVASKEDQNSVAFRKFRRQLTHTSFSAILMSAKPGMESYKVNKCCDGHFRRTIYGIACVICDYPDQVAHTCIVQNWCPT